MKRSPMPPRTKPMPRSTTPMKRTELRAKPVRKSRRQAEKDRLYPPACRRVEQRSEGLCEALTPICTGLGECHHHRRSRDYDEQHLTLIHACAACHYSWIHTSKHAAEARELGLLLPNITIEADPWVPPSERKAA